MKKVTDPTVLKSLEGSDQPPAGPGGLRKVVDPVTLSALEGRNEPTMGVAHNTGPPTGNSPIDVIMRSGGEGELQPPAGGPMLTGRGYTPEGIMGQAPQAPANANYPAMGREIFNAAQTPDILRLLFPTYSSERAPIEDVASKGFVEGVKGGLSNTGKSLVEAPIVPAQYGLGVYDRLIYGPIGGKIRALAEGQTPLEEQRSSDLEAAYNADIAAGRDVIRPYKPGYTDLIMNELKAAKDWVKGIVEHPAKTAYERPLDVAYLTEMTRNAVKGIVDRTDRKAPEVRYKEIRQEHPEIPADQALKMANAEANWMPTHPPLDIKKTERGYDPVVEARRILGDRENYSDAEVRSAQKTIDEAPKGKAPTGLLEVRVQPEGMPEKNIFVKPGEPVAIEHKIFPGEPPVKVWTIFEEDGNVAMADLGSRESALRTYQAAKTGKTGWTPPEKPKGAAPEEEFGPLPEELRPTGPELTPEEMAQPPQPKAKAPAQKTMLSWIRAKGGIDTAREGLTGELKMLSENKNTIGLIKKGSGYTLDELAGMARDEGIISEATPQAMLDAIEKDAPLPGVEKSQTALGKEAKAAQEKAQGLKEGMAAQYPQEVIDAANLRDGETVKINGETYTKSTEPDGHVILKDGHTYRLPEDFATVRVDKGSPQPPRGSSPTGEAPPSRGANQLFNDREFKDTMQGKIPAKEAGETPLEKANREAQGRKVAAEEKAANQDMFSGESVTSGKLPEEPSAEAGKVALPANAPGKFKSFWDSFRDFINPLSSLGKKGKQAYLEKRYKQLGWETRSEDLAMKLWKKTRSYSPEIKQKMFWYLDGSIPIEQLPMELRQTAKSIQGAIRRVGKMAVDRGILNEKTWKENENQYVRYTYLKHILGDKANGAIRSNGKLDMTYLKSRKDLTLEQQRAIGLIEDVSVAAPMSIAKPLSDIGKYDFMDFISKNKDWVWEPSMVEVGVKKFQSKKQAVSYAAQVYGKGNYVVKQEGQLPLLKKEATPESGNQFIIFKKDGKIAGERMGIGAIADEIALQKKLVEQAPNVPEIKQRLERLESALVEAQTRAGKETPKGYVQFPTSKEYGPLAGAYVRKTIAQDILPVMSGFRSGGSLSNAINTVMNLSEKGMAAFKAAHVALNPPTMFRNAFSNMIQLNLSGMPTHMIPVYMAKAARAMWKKEAIYTQAKRFGLYRTNWGQAEIADILGSLKTLEKKGYPDIMAGLGELASKYGKIDDFFKTAKFIEQVGKGKTYAQAAVEAHKWGMDYSLAHPLIKFSRRHLTPFITYQYKILPLLGEAAIKRPWVFAKYAALPWLAKKYVMEQDDLSDEDWKQLEKNLPMYIEKEGSYALLPWKSPEGNYQWFNLQYFYPWGNVVDLAENIKGGGPGDVLSDVGLSNPYADIIYATFKPARNGQPPRDPFTGRELYNRLDTPKTKLLKTLEWLYNKWAPGAFTRYGAAGYSYRYAEGKKDTYGRKVTGPQAGLRWLGVNIVAPTPDQARRYKAYLRSEITRSYKALLKEAGDDKEKRKEAYEAYKKMLKEIQ